MKNKLLVLVILICVGSSVSFVINTNEGNCVSYTHESLDAYYEKGEFRAKTWVSNNCKTPKTIRYMILKSRDVSNKENQMAPDRMAMIGIILDPGEKQLLEQTFKLDDDGKGVQHFVDVEYEATRGSLSRAVYKVENQQLE